MADPFITKEDIQWAKDLQDRICAPLGVSFSELARERARIREDERQRAHDIALAIDSGRGNEKEIARAIMDRTPPSKESGT